MALRAMADGLKRLLWHRDGAAAIEYALVAIPFFGLTLVILETGLMMLANGAVQNAVTVAARLVRTGQVQAPSSCLGSGTTAAVPAAFTASVLADTDALGAIGAATGTTALDLVFDVRSYASFGAANQTWTPAYDDGVPPQPTNNCFDTGASSAIAGTNSIVVVRVAYNYHFVTPGLGMLFGSPAATFIPFMYTVIFRNEPF